MGSVPSVRAERSPRAALAVALGLALVAGCQCFVPVSECSGDLCPGDGGRRDGGTGGIGGGSGGGVGGGSGGSGGSGGGGGAGVDGGVLACARWDGGGVGMCAALTGYVFEGTTCTGQCVTYPIATPGVHPTLERCVQCGCDESKISQFPPGPPVGPSTYCDVLLVTTTVPRLIYEAFPGIDAGCQPVGALDYRCTLWRRELGDAGYARACAATLIPRVSDVRCLIYI